MKLLTLILLTLGLNNVCYSQSKSLSIKPSENPVVYAVYGQNQKHIVLHTSPNILEREVASIEILPAEDFLKNIIYPPQEV